MKQGIIALALLLLIIAYILGDIMSRGYQVLVVQLVWVPPLL